MRFKKIEIPEYKTQQKLLDKIAKQLGVVAYRPDYHAKRGDPNTVLFYSKEDEIWNRKVEKTGNGSFRSPFFYFQNTDLNGQEDFRFANRGKIDFRYPDFESVLEGYVSLAFYLQRQTEYAVRFGGYNGIPEADQCYNDLNREVIKAFHRAHKKAYLGSYNYYGKDADQIRDGSKSVYEEYTEEMTVYNFQCSFLVPHPDKKLEEMIIAWNANHMLPARPKQVEDMTNRVEQIGGINLVWY